MRDIQKKESVKNVGANNTQDNHIISDLNSQDLGRYTITARINVSLIETIKNIVISSRTSGNFEYTNMSDLLRRALEEYKNGMSLTTQRMKGSKKEMTFRVTKELLEFYAALPNNAKSEIMERAVSTFIKDRM